MIGGGLTAIDTATESLAYYVVQVEKFLKRYEALVTKSGETEVRASGRRRKPRSRRSSSRTRARFGRNAPRQHERAGSRDLIELLNSWGGVTIAYRRRLIDAPSYTLNHEEVAKALEEGVRFAECLAPEEVEMDRYGAAAALRVEKLRFDDATDKLRADRREGRAAGAHDSGGRRHAAQHGAGARRRAQLSCSTAAISRRSMKRATGEAGAHREASGGARADVSAAGRAGHQLFRRSASFVLRQRGQGDGQREAGLSGGFARACRDMAAARTGARRHCSIA